MVVKRGEGMPSGQREGRAAHWWTWESQAARPEPQRGTQPVGALTSVARLWLNVALHPGVAVRLEVPAWQLS